MRSSLPWYALLLLVAFCGSAAAQPPKPLVPDVPPEADSSKLPDFFNRKPLAANPKDDELQKLLKGRYNTALQEINVLKRLYSAGQADLQSLHQAAAGRLCPAAREALPATERLEFFQQYVEVAKSMEQLARARFESAVASNHEVIQATYQRQTAEIELLKLKREAKAAAR